jgi:hypothetical protein
MEDTVGDIRAAVLRLGQRAADGSLWSSGTRRAFKITFELQPGGSCWTFGAPEHGRPTFIEEDDAAPTLRVRCPARVLRGLLVEHAFRLKPDEPVEYAGSLSALRELSALLRSLA